MTTGTTDLTKPATLASVLKSKRITGESCLHWITSISQNAPNFNREYTGETIRIRESSDAYESLRIPPWGLQGK